MNSRSFTRNTLGRGLPDPGGFSRRDLFKVGGMGAALALLPGCAGASGTGAQNEETLPFTSWTFSDGTAGPVQDAVDRFTQQYGFSVSPRAYPYDQYLNQLVLAARGGRMAGIVHIDEEWMSTLANAEVISPLDAIVDEDRYPEVVRATGEYQGARYSMPWTQSAIGLVVNNQMLDDLGIDTDSVKSIDSFTAMLRQIQKADSSLIPYAPCTDVTQLKDFIPWVWAFGGGVYTGGEITLGDEPSRRALDYWKMLLDEGLIQSGVDREDARTLFAQGQTPIYDDAPQAYDVVPAQSNDPEIAQNMGALARPSLDGPGENMMWSQPLVALDDSSTTFEALQFFSTDTQALESVFGNLGNPPATSEALEAPWFTEVDFHHQWSSRVMMNARRNPLWEFPVATSAQRAHDEAIERGLRGAASTTQALAEGREALNDLL